MPARVLEGKDTSVNVKAAPASKAVAQPRPREHEPSLNEFTSPTFSWDIGSVALSAPDDVRKNPGGNAVSALASGRWARSPLAIQPKLEVGAVDDPLECEADRVAEQVMRMPDPAAPAGTSDGNVLQRKCANCEEEEEDVEETPTKIARKASDEAAASAAEVPPIVRDVLRSPGQPLDAATRDFFEPRFSYDFAQVRVHTDSRAAQSVRAVGAQAYTVGRHIAFGAAKFAPGSAEGQELLAHELTHAVQQRSVSDNPGEPLTLSEAGDTAETEADVAAKTVLDVDVPGARKATPSISEHRQPMALTAPAKKKKTPKPKPIKFKLFNTSFNASVDATNNVTITKVGKSSDGWAFTPSGANKVNAERTLDHHEYVHAGGATDQLAERCTITVPAGGPATHSPIVAEVGSPASLSLPLSSAKTAPRKTITVNGVTVEQLDVAAGAITFTPADGDEIHLGLGGDAWVFSTIKPDPAPAGAAAAPDVTGFFRVGYFTRYVDHGVPTFGTATPSVPDSQRKKALDDLADPSLPATRRITTDETERFKTVSLIESDFAGVQTYDTGILSFGFAQWTVNADLPGLLKKLKAADAATFEKYLGRYGLDVGNPVRQLDSFVHKFVSAHRERLGVRNLSEGALFLNGKELVNKKLLDKAGSQDTALAALATQATTAKGEIDIARPDLNSKDKTRRAAALQATAAARTKVNGLRTALGGLAGFKAVTDLSGQAALFAKIASDGSAACQDLVANCEASEALRGKQWALRFEMLGQSAGGQDAEVAEARADWNEVSGKTTHGADFTTLLPNLRGQSALLSSYLNTHGAAAGVGRAVEAFKDKKKKEAAAAATAAAKAKLPAPTPTPADWVAFPWNSGDRRWTTMWTGPVIDDFEQIAINEITKPTTDPKRRRDIIKTQFP